MLIGGMQTLTLVDFPGCLAATIFTAGCNFRCHFCHNPELVFGLDAKHLSEKEVLDFLQKRKAFLDGICITGGEPTIHRDLDEFIKKIKKMNLKVKLDTNGTNYQMLKKLINEKLIDYVAMDIKAPWNKYEKVVNQRIDVGKIKKSVALLLSNVVSYEFRSTILPSLHPKKDIIEMAGQIRGADQYYLQQFKPFDKMVNEEYKNSRPYKSAELKKIKDQIKKYVKVCEVRENL